MATGGKEAQVGAATTFHVYGSPLNTSLTFKYLEQILTAMENDLSKVIPNLQKMRRIWARLSRILGQGGADTWTLGNFNLAIVQAVLLLGTENWFVTPRIRRMLRGFHHRVVRPILGKKLRRGRAGP